ncbi:MAG TPA: hypothetical protein VGM90_13680 [Kofleriaceae bacterium]|jgi:hypothetical protein
MRYTALSAAFIVLAFAAPARAGVLQHLDDARGHFAGLDFELVITDTDAVIHDASATPAQLVDAWFLRGSTLIVLDRESEAAAAFESLLAIAPEHRPPADTPSRIRAAFEAARAAHAVHVEEQLATEHGAELKAVKLDVAPPVAPRGGHAAAWTVQLVDPSHLVDRIVLGYRRETDRSFNVVEAQPGAKVSLTLPGGAPSSDGTYRLAWYVEATHGAGARVRTNGGPQSPNYLDVAAGHPPAPPPLTHRWYFWASVATLAVSAVAVPLVVDHYRDVGGEHVVFTQ